jgi:ATP-binding cassette subfamily B protein
MSVLWRLYRFIWRRPLPFVGGSVFLVLGMILGNLAPFFVKWLTEAVQANQLDTAMNLVLGFGVVLFVSNILDNLGFYIIDKNMVSTSTTISQAVLTHIHNLDFVYHTNKSSGKLISLVKRGDEAFFTYYDIFNRTFLSLVISFGIMFVAFLQLKPLYIGFVSILILVSMSVAWVLVKENIRRRKVFNKVDDEVSALRVDNLVNFDTVKYFAKEVFEQHRFRELLNRWDDSLQNYFFTFRYFDGIVGNIVNVALVGIMAMAIYDVRRGTITLAEFLLVTTFSMTLLPKLLNLLYSMRELAKKYTDLQVYLDLLEEPITVIDPVEPEHINKPQGEIRFNAVTFQYEKGGQTVLADFDLHIKPGESVAFVGYSGAGKTTIAKLLMRMYDPTIGSVAIDGVNVRNVLKSELRTLIGIVPQDPLLFNNSIYYNIAYARDGATREEVLAAAKAAKVDEFVQQLPNGYDTIVGERGIKLSGGQRQRLAIARILLEQPQVIILDEATSALDSASEQTIQTAFWELVRNPERPLTSIIIAHRLSTIMRADRIVVMEKGKIVEIGSHEQLIKNTKGIYYQLWSLQRNGFIADGES